MYHKIFAGMALFFAVAFIGTGQAFAEVDATPPVISGVSATSTQTTASVSFTTDEPAYGQLAYGTTTAYGITTAWETATGTAHAIALASLTASTTYHFMVSAKDEAGNIATTTDATFETLAVPPPPDTTAPVSSGVSATSTQTTATITWTTDESAVGRVAYGTTTAYGAFTAWETATGTAHSVMLTGLASSTTYHFAVVAKDAAGNTATSSDYAVTTLAPSVIIPPPTATSTADVMVKLKVEPKTINGKSKGKWVQIRVMFPEGYDARDVDMATVKLNGVLSPERVKVKAKKNKKHDDDDDEYEDERESSLNLKFSRRAVIDLIAASASSTASTATGTSTVPFVAKDITVSGKIGTKTFAGSIAIRFIGGGDLPEGTIVRPEGASEVYIIFGGKRRHIPTARAFEELGYRWDRIMVVSSAVADAYADDALIRASDSPAVYLIAGGKKRHVTDPAAFEAQGLDWEDIAVVNSRELGYYATVSAVTLLRAAGDEKVYFISGGERHWVPSVTIFQKRGYKWEDIVIVDESERDKYKEGARVD